MIGDGTVATIMAYDMLIVYLRKEIDDLQINLEPQKNIPMEKPSKLFWTGNKTDLIELLYALHSSKCINSGTTDIKELASHFEHFYNVLDAFSANFHEKSIFAEIILHFQRGILYSNIAFQINFT